MTASLVTTGASSPPASDGLASTRATAFAATRTTIPADQLYWAVLDPSVLGPRSPRQLRELAEQGAAELIDLLAAKLPVDSEEVHSVFAALGDGRVLAVAVSLDKLVSLQSSDLLAVTPDALPQELGTDVDTDPQRLNFLVGEHEPVPIRVARQRIGWVAAFALIAVTGLGLVGIERRAAAIREGEQAALAATNGVLSQVLGRDVERSDGIATIEGELQRLRQTRMRPDSDQEDAPLSLAALMAAWPRGEAAPHVRTDSLSVGHGSMTLSVTADDRAAAVSIAEALRTIKGWTLIQPQMSAADNTTGAVRLQLRFVLDEAAAAGEAHP